MDFILEGYDHEFWRNMNSRHFFSSYAHSSSGGAKPKKELLCQYLYLGLPGGLTKQLCNWTSIAWGECARMVIWMTGCWCQNCHNWAMLSLKGWGLWTREFSVWRLDQKLKKRSKTFWKNCPINNHYFLTLQIDHQTWSPPITSPKLKMFTQRHH